ncbi:hypothetical protein ACILG0_03110 [Pseudomonadota bacterium AL_CKDN230030165-1A_HGKHYDSX7]
MQVMKLEAEMRGRAQPERAPMRMPGCAPAARVAGRGAARPRPGIDAGASDAAPARAASTLPAAPGDIGAAAQAVTLVMPMIERALADEAVGGEDGLHVVVLDPAADPRRDPFERAVLYELSVGDQAGSAGHYADQARTRAQLSYQTGLSGRDAATLAPYLLPEGQAHAWGSVVVDGLVVAVCGANPWYDEAFAGAIAHAFQAVRVTRGDPPAAQGDALAGT